MEAPLVLPRRRGPSRASLRYLKPGLLAVGAAALLSVGALTFSRGYDEQAGRGHRLNTAMVRQSRVGHVTGATKTTISRRKTSVNADYGAPPAVPNRRVVITGLGAVSPLANNLQETWDKIKKGETGVKKLEDPKFDILPTKVAAYIKDLQTEGIIPPKDAKQMAPFIKYSMVAAKEAMDDANWHPEEPKDKQATGVSIGSGIGGIEEITDNHKELLAENRGYKKISPRFIPKMLINLANGFVSMAYGLQGPNIAAVTACATGSHCIGDAFKLIKHGEADVMVAGGAESAVEPLSMAGFNRMNALVTKFNDEPEKASRPFHEQRAGFVMGEGARVMVLEEYQHAKAPGA
eukprot:jgi/Bigna1/89924/estExt_fgenesh1_pg.C_580065